MSRPDLVLRNARILDGTGSPPFEGDVEVDGGRITAVGDGAHPASTEIDCAGKTLAPGFVDTHTHDDGALLLHPGLEFKLAQGCTSLVIGNCGFSAIPRPTGALFGNLNPDWDDLDGFRRRVDSAGVACNAIALIGHNSIRSPVVDPARRAPNPAELGAMQSSVTRAMEQGACGLSTGLVYVPGRFSTTEEIVALAEMVAPFGGLYATHMRNEGDRLLESVQEAISIGHAAGVSVHISHHKAAGRANWGKVQASLDAVDQANTAGGDITLDMYPYTAGSGPMAEYFDLERIDLELASVIRLASCPAFPDYEGRMLVDIAASEGISLEDAVRQVITAPKGDRTICIQFLMDEADLEANLRHPLMMIGSDGIPDLSGRPHPRLFGTFPRILGEYVRSRHVIPLAEAVRRMTSLSCRRFGLAERGEIREGWWADLVLFDPDAVGDTATYDDPMQEPAGIDLVVVNGQIAYRDGQHTGAGAGRLLHYAP